MSGFAYSIALSAPAARQADANRIACALGRDRMPGSTFVVPLSADGNAPATHFGAHAFGDAGFVAQLQAGLRGQLPPIDWRPFDLTTTSVIATFASMTVVSIEAKTAAAWPAALAQAGLQRVIDIEKVDS